ncbi:hypothetical protein NBH00_11345 [Paraconexibacter antarcticus]|uniref:Uncharacterized protein n=1 Tax=Paraconexibacter antarcticus TaxID=2949664 RepID=A0ABY5E1R3_9ACTN|nr:hypothetical protein [Paraconexibacter antarcticus]UTI66777.1 hypothetical protein NBH00_11345 [Paraconexibacter antarcticus]
MSWVFRTGQSDDARGGVRDRAAEATIALWAAVTLVLVVQGLSFAARISPSSIEVPGTSSEKAQQVAARYFGIDASISVLLEGPRADLDRQGRRLVRRLRVHKDYRVLSPWDRGAKIPELRAREDAARLPSPHAWPSQPRWPNCRWETSTS